MDAAEIDFGPDRVLPCGCHVINGAICLVSPSAGLPLRPDLFQRPGRIIAVPGPSENGTSSSPTPSA